MHIDLTGYCPIHYSLWRDIRRDRPTCFRLYCAKRVIIIGTQAKRIARDSNLALLSLRLNVERRERITTHNVDGLLFNLETFRVYLPLFQTIGCYHENQTDYRRL